MNTIAVYVLDNYTSGLNVFMRGDWALKCLKNTLCVWI